MGIEKGELLYEETHKEIKKYKRICILGLIVFAVIFFAVGSLLVLDFFGYIQGRKETEEFRPFSILFASFFMFMVFASLRGISGHIDTLKIYENGISIPWKTITQAIRREENFISFEKINSLYLNKKLDLPYITLELEVPKRKIEKVKRAVSKKEIYDLDRFVEILKDKVKIVTDRDLPI